MMKTYQETLFVLALCMCFSVNVLAQSGGTFEITQSVIANGGGASSRGNFGVTGTSAQPLAGTISTNGQYSVRGGFWQAFFAPTAAMVAVSGQVLTSESNSISKARLTLTDGSGAIRGALTNSFGYFRFDDVEAGQVYIISIESKRYQFANPIQVVYVGDEITNLNFIALP